MKAKDEFIETVKRYAKARNLSLRALAKELGYSPSHFHEMLSGKRNLDMDAMKKIGEFFEIPVLVVYQEAGVVDKKYDVENIDTWVLKLREIAEHDENLRTLVDALAEMPAEERRERVLLILAALGKRVQEQNNQEKPSL